MKKNLLTISLIAACMAISSCGKSTENNSGNASNANEAASGIKIAYVELDTLMSQYQLYIDYSQVLSRKGNNIEKLNDDLLRIPLFEEYLKICKDSGCVAFIETKGNVVAPVIDMVKYMKLTDRAVLSSTQYDHIAQTRSISDIFVHHIFSDHQKMLEISQMGNGGVSYNYPNLDDVPYGLIEQTHKHNVKVCLRAGDNRDTVNRMLALGLDYIPTNCFVPESKAPQCHSV
jgi:phage pi2 protein 07